MSRVYRISFALIILLTYSIAFAYDDKLTHPSITEKAIEASHLDKYLSEVLGFENDLDTTFSLSSNDGLVTPKEALTNTRYPGGTDFYAHNILRLLKDGSYSEDSPLCRASNHFYDPISGGGVSDNGFLNWICSGYDYTLKSNLAWATSSAYALSQSGNPDASVNWTVARDEFYNALISNTPASRDIHFANTFLALGHVLHLMEDMGVPAHVRNDFDSHLSLVAPEEFWNYENYKGVLNTITAMGGNPYEHYVKTHDLALFSGITPVMPNITNPSVRDFWDTETINGVEPYTAENNKLGLAEYTNYNYLSGSTIPSNYPGPGHHYNYPDVNSMIGANNYIVCNGRKYFSKTNNCNNVLGASSLVFEVSEHGEILSTTKGLVLDEKTYGTNASNILPHAVGYSAALVDYFFRGRIAGVSPSVSSDRHAVSMKIKNNSSEAIGPGDVRLSLKNNGSNPEEIIVSREASIINTIQPNSSTNRIDFVFDTPIPEDTGDLSATLIYNGNLGGESDAVAASSARVSNSIAFAGYNQGMKRLYVSKGTLPVSYDMSSIVTAGKAVKSVRIAKNQSSVVAVLVVSTTGAEMHLFKLIKNAQGNGYSLTYLSNPTTIPLSVDSEEDVSTQINFEPYIREGCPYNERHYELKEIKYPRYEYITSDIYILDENNVFFVGKYSLKGQISYKETSGIISHPNYYLGQIVDYSYSTVDEYDEDTVEVFYRICSECNNLSSCFHTSQPFYYLNESLIDERSLEDGYFISNGYKYERTPIIKDKMSNLHSTNWISSNTKSMLPDVLALNRNTAGFIISDTAGGVTSYKAYAGGQNQLNPGNQLWKSILRLGGYSIATKSGSTFYSYDSTGAPLCSDLRYIFFRTSDDVVIIHDILSQYIEAYQGFKDCSVNSYRVNNLDNFLGRVAYQGYNSYDFVVTGSK